MTRGLLFDSDASWSNPNVICKSSFVWLANPLVTLLDYIVYIYIYTHIHIHMYNIYIYTYAKYTHILIGKKWWCQKYSVPSLRLPSVVTLLQPLLKFLRLLAPRKRYAAPRRATHGALAMCVPMIILFDLCSYCFIFQIWNNIWSFTNLKSCPLFRSFSNDSAKEKEGL